MAEKLLRDDIVRQINDVFNKQLKNPVQILFFGTKNNCEQCKDAQQLIHEVVELSDKLHLSIYDLDEHADLARQYNVTMTPGMVIAAKDDDQVIDYGIRLFGIPSGYEFSSLIQDLLLVSNRDSGLDTATRQALKELTKPVILQVFVTPN